MRVLYCLVKGSRAVGGFGLRETYDFTILRFSDSTILLLAAQQPSDFPILRFSDSTILLLAAQQGRDLFRWIWKLQWSHDLVTKMPQEAPKMAQGPHRHTAQEASKMAPR